jgi:hypothetical protein
MIQLLVITFLVNWFILEALIKWKVIDFYEVVRKKWMPDADCYLCLGFWLCCITGYPIYLIFISAWWGVLLPFCVGALINYFKK